MILEYESIHFDLYSSFTGIYSRLLVIGNHGGINDIFAAAKVICYRNPTDRLVKRSVYTVVMYL